MAIRAAQEQNFRVIDYRWGDLGEDGLHFPHLMPKLTPMLKFGVTLEYHGHPPSIGHSENYPNNRAHSIEILNKFRKVALGRKVFTNSSSLNDGGAQTAPTTLAPKRNPDRTLSVGKRLISDLRRVNIHFDSKDCYPAAVPSVTHLAAEIMRLQRLRPGIPAIM